MKNLLTCCFIIAALGVFAQRTPHPVLIKKSASNASKQFGQLAGGTILFSEDFESGTAFPLNGITVKTKSNDGGYKIGSTADASAGQAWKVPSASKIAYTSDDKCNCNKSADSLFLPSLNLSTNTAYQLVVDVYFNSFSVNESAKVLVKNGGIVKELKSITSQGNWQKLTIPLFGLSGSTQIILSYSDGGTWGSGLAVDNIAVCEPSEGVNLALERVYLNDLNPSNFYSQIPAHQASKTPIDIDVNVLNLGRFSATKSAVKLDLSGYGSLSSKSDEFSLLANEDTLLNLKERFLAANGVGAYNFNLVVESDSIETNTDKDTFRFDIDVTDTVYSRVGNEVPVAGFWYGPGVNYDLSSLIEMKAPDTATSISVFIDEYAKVGAQFDVIILNEFFQSRVIPQVFPQLDQDIAITAKHLGKWNTFKIPPTPMPIGNYYIGIKSKTDSVIVGVSGSRAQNGISIVNIGTGHTQSEYLPLVKLNTSKPICDLQISSQTVNPSCGSNNGSINLTVLGANGSLSYQWGTTNPGDTNSTISSLSAGNYVVTVSDSLGCSEVYHKAVVNFGAPLISVKKVLDENCFNDNNGEITIDIIPRGVGPFTIKWSNGKTDTNLTGLSSGNYFVTVTNSSNPACVSARRVTVKGPKAPLSVDFETIDNFCFNDKNGRIQANVKGGVPSYQYTWEDTSFKTNVVSGVESGMYLLTVTDTNNCALVDSIEIKGTPRIVVSSSVNDTGGTANISVEVKGGSEPFIYAWSGPTGFRNPGTKDLTDLRIRGQYTLSVTDKNGCTIKDISNIQGSVQVMSFDKSNSIKVFPNPSNRSISVDLVEMMDVSYRLSDISGKTVYSEDLGSVAHFSIENQNAGIYFLNVMANGELFNVKLVFTK